ncbi:MAG: L,D-transpeptidase [Actinobacteria bacterium]|nr:L,D-transpeptidase [Actinomycetota bacterium]
MTQMKLAIRAVALCAIAIALSLFSATAIGAQEVPPVPTVPVVEVPPPAPPAPDLRGLPFNSGSGRRVVYSMEQQRVWWVEEDGSVVHTYLVSGRYKTPGEGTYSVFSKSRYTTSVGGGASMQWMVRFAQGSDAAIGFHSIPVNRRGQPLQSEDELGSYRSHGCVRQSNWNASLLYEWAQIGTQVVVVK